MKQQKIEITKKKSDLKTDDKGNKFFEFKLKSSNALILHPSFCCPVMVEHGKPISIFILADSDFYKGFCSEVEAKPNPLLEDGIPQVTFCQVTTGVKGGGMIKRHINQMLKCTTWDNIEKYSQMQDDPIPPMYDSATKAEHNIQVTYLDEITKPTELKDKDGMIFANLRESSFKKYAQDEELKYLFQIELSNIDHLKQGLYDLSWVTYNDKVFDDFSEKDVEDESDCREFYEKQDQITRKYICEDEKRKGFTHAYEVDGEKLEFEVDTRTPIQNHHPVYIVESGKKKLGLGHLSDVHVSSRQHAFKTCKAQVIPGADEADSPKIGELVNASFYTLRNLMDDFGSDADIDLLIFTGDLIDYGRNYNPKNKFINNPNATTGDIWDQMTLDNVDKKFEDGDDAGKEMYPHSIDNVLIYSLFRRFYQKYKKPILLVSGNHECYTLPYGISPRLKKAKTIWNNITSQFSDKDISEVLDDANQERQKDWADRVNNGDDEYTTAQKANEGIPADHNLTIYEATLMYGPDYNMIPLGGFADGDEIKNFKPENLDWFYNIFTPLEDFAISFNNTQHFIGLGWGQKERFISLGDMMTFGGHLPRSPEAVTDEQLKLIKSAIDSQKGDNILLSHFTFVNYDANKAYYSDGEVNYNDTWKNQTDSCTGTFENNRYEVYKMIVDGEKIQYTLSGHSHRNGVYICTDPDSSWMPGRYNFEATPIRLNMESLQYNDSGAGTKMIVSSSGGPIGKQNFENELFNWSLDFPSGSYVKFNKNLSESIGIKRAKNKEAKPRFAVALEFADLVGREQLGKDCGIFKTIKLSEDGGVIELEINHELDVVINSFISEIKVFLTAKEETTTLSFTFTKSQGSKLLFNASRASKWLFKTEVSKLKAGDMSYFLSCSFSPITREHKFSYYDFSTPLTIRTQMTNIKDRIKEEYQKLIMHNIGYSSTGSSTLYQQMQNEIDKNSGYLIERDKQNGEVVDHALLSDQEPEEFNFDWSKRV